MPHAETAVVFVGQDDVFDANNAHKLRPGPRIKGPWVKRFRQVVKVALAIAGIRIDQVMANHHAKLYVDAEMNKRPKALPAKPV